MTGESLPVNQKSTELEERREASRRYLESLTAPINKVSTVNLITSPAEDVLFDKLNEVIDRINYLASLND